MFLLMMLILIAYPTSLTGVLCHVSTGCEKQDYCLSEKDLPHLFAKDLFRGRAALSVLPVIWQYAGSAAHIDNIT